MKNILFKFCVLFFAAAGIFGSANAKQEISADLDAEYTNEFYVIKAQSPLHRNNKINEQVYRPDLLTLDTDRDPTDVIFRRTDALVSHIKTLPGAPDMTKLQGLLNNFRVRLTNTDVKDVEARLKLFKEIAHVRREITLSNPLLDFSKVLFVKSQLSGTWHCCDQYFGKNYRPGGGVYVLSDVFGPNPKLVDLLADSVVQNGRLKGEKLDGSFLSPELSFDGKEILFA
ncbi:MAG: hypothetical protein K9M75_02780, partial [Phycisphaerae bacterium]|nr:hypothetical protein [Phycisphaerae bacterium]